MAYVFSTNNAPLNPGEAVLQMKSTLVAAGWTVLSSGTGNSGAGSGVFSLGDNLTTAALMGNPGAWFVVQSPAGAGTASFGFASYGSGGYPENWVIAFDPVSSWVAPASAGALPLGASGIWIFGNPSIAVNRWLPSAGPTYAWNVCADNAAPYPFWVSGIALGGGSAPTGLLFEAVTGGPAGDARPYVVGVFSNQFGDGVFSVTTPGPFAAQTWTGYDPALVVGTSEPCASFYLQNTSGQQPYSSSVVNPITGKDELYPLLYARTASAGGAWQGLKGIGVLAQAGGTSRAVGDTYSVNSTRDRIRLGNGLVLPWDGSVPVF